MQLRVVAYNVRGFRQGLGLVVRVVERLQPDVLLRNESGGRLRLRRFAHAVAMELAPDPWSPLRRRVKNAVLVRPPWVVVGHRLHRFEGGSNLLPRGALVAHLGRGGGRLSRPRTRARVSTTCSCPRGSRSSAYVSSATTRRDGPRTTARWRP